MPIRPAQFDDAATRLAPVLHNLPGRLVAIDGRMGAGKTTLGRFLSWYFNVTLVETDPFLLGDGGLSRRTIEIERIVSFRLDRSSPRPVIVEGVGALELLQEMGRGADSLLYVENSLNEVVPSSAVLEYERRFRPRQVANIIVDVAHES